MKEEIYEKLVITLENLFGDGEAFLRLDTQTLESILFETLDGRDFEEFKEEVRRALSFFFSQRGLKSYIFFKSSKEIALKTKVFDFDSNIYTQLILENLGDATSYLIPAKNKKGVFLLQDKVTAFVYDKLKVLSDEEEKKEVIRSILKLSLSLQPRDAIFFVSGQIMIKKFQEVEAEKERRMFDGIPEETLLEIEQKALQAGLKNKLYALAKQLSNNELSFSRFDNLYFAKNFIQIFQEKFLTLLPPEVDSEEPLIKQAYANFLLRRYFDTLMLHLSKALLGLLVEKDRKAEAFVRFYNGDISFSPEGKRFKKPDIIDSEGNRWNSATLFQVGAQRKAGLEKIQKNDDDIAKTKEIIDNIQAGIDEQKNFLAQKAEEIEKLEAEFRHMLDISQQAKDKIFSLKRLHQEKKGTPQAQAIQEKINELSIQIKKLDKEDERVLGEKKKLESEIEKAQIKIVTLEKDKLAFEKKLERNLVQKSTLLEKQVPLDERYQVAAEALSKAISSFRGY